MKDYLMPFVVMLIVFSTAFLSLDILIMKLQGLSLIFQP